MAQMIGLSDYVSGMYGKSCDNNKKNKQKKKKIRQKFAFWPIVSSLQWSITANM